MALDNLFFIEGSGLSPKLLSTATGKTAGGIYMAKLGDYQFCLDTAAFQDLQRTTAYRWQSVPRIGRKPAQQFTGFDEETIELSGVIYPHFRGGIGQLDLMRQQAGTGKPLPLIYAFERLGQYAGLWCIRSIREGRREFFQDGRPRMIEFQLSLVAYGEDAGDKRAVLANPASATPQTTTLPVPSQLGNLGKTVTTNDNLIESLDIWRTGVDSVDKLVNFAVRMKSVAASAKDIAENGRVGLLRLVENGLEPEVMAMLPDSAKGAASAVFGITKQIAGTYDEVAREITVLERDAEGLRTISRNYENTMRGYRRDYIQSAGLLKSVLGDLSKAEHVEGVGDVARITASATIRNASRIADQMIFATTEAGRQIATIGGKIL